MRIHYLLITALSQIISQASLAQSMVCADLLTPPAPILANNITDESVLISMTNPITPSGYLKVHNLNTATATPNRAVYKQIIDRILNNQYSEIQLQNNDIVLEVEVRGDKNAWFKGLVTNFMSHHGLDITGMHIAPIDYKRSEGGELTSSIARKNQQRLLIVIKNTATDFREGRDLIGNRLESPEDIASWAAWTIGDLFEAIYGFPALHFDSEDSPRFKNAYDFLKTRPQNFAHLGTEMPAGEFIKAYQKALPKFLLSLSGGEALMIRRSFFESAPLPDTFAQMAYRFSAQGGAATLSDHFFKEQNILLQRRLYNLIHRLDSPGRGSAENLPLTDTVSESRGMSPRASSLVSEQSLSVNGQENLGTDFFIGVNHSNAPLSDLIQIGNGPLNEAIVRLEQYGVNDMSELKRYDASKLMDETNLTIGELFIFAEALAENGVYLSYPTSLLLQFDSIERAIIKPSGVSNSFTFSPSTNTYSPRRGDREED